MINWRKELRDQPLHVATGALIVLPVVLAPGLLTLTWAFFAAGTLREVTEEGTPVTPAKIIYAITHSKMDLTGWTLGGFLIGLALRTLGLI